MFVPHTRMCCMSIITVSRGDLPTHHSASSHLSTTQHNPHGLCSIYHPHVCFRDADVQLSERGLCDPCGSEAMVVGLRSGNLVWGRREWKLVQAVALHKCVTYPQAQDFRGGWMKKEKRQQSKEADPCASDALLLWKQMQYLMWFLAYLMFDQVNVFACIIKKSACSNFALCVFVIYAEHQLRYTVKRRVWKLLSPKASLHTHMQTQTHYCFPSNILGFCVAVLANQDSQVPKQFSIW